MRSLKFLRIQLWDVQKKLAKAKLLVDEHPDNINDNYFVVDMNGYPDNLSPSRLVDFPASYHKGAAGFAFADGHAEIKKWLDKRTKTPPLNM